MGQQGIIYLIHFDQGLVVRTEPNGTVVYARHYIGWTSNHDQRLAEHDAGRGSSLMAAVKRAGISWRVVRMWEGTRSDERKIKRCRNAPRYCPCCKESRGEKARGLDDPGLPELKIGGSQMAKDAAGHNRMRIGSGWISVDPEDMSITISDGDGYTLPQTIICDTQSDLDLVIEYIQSGKNPRPEPMGREHTKDDGWTYIAKIDGTANDFRYRPMGVRVQAEVYVEATETWENFGVFKDKDDMYGEIELSRAEPRHD